MDRRDQHRRGPCVISQVPAEGVLRVSRPDALERVTGLRELETCTDCRDYLIAGNKPTLYESIPPGGGANRAQAERVVQAMTVTPMVVRPLAREKQVSEKAYVRPAHPVHEPPIHPEVAAEQLRQQRERPNYGRDWDAIERDLDASHRNPSERDPDLAKKLAQMRRDQERSLGRDI